MKQEKNLCEFDLQDSPHELDHWICWPSAFYQLADKFGEETLFSTLTSQGLIDSDAIPIIPNPKFKHFRSLNVGFTDPGNKWQTVKEHCLNPPNSWT